MRAVAVVGVVLGLVVPAAFAGAAEQAASGAKQPVAVVAGQVITAEDLTQFGGARLFQARSQQYEAERQVLDEAIAERLLRREAASRGISLEELERVEIDSKVPAISDTEKQSVYEANKARLGTMSETEALRRIEQDLRTKRTRERRDAVVRELREKAGVKVLLQPPRIEVDEGGRPGRGPVDAPVRIIEFSDFQCPYCARAQPALSQLLQTYGDRIRFVHRDYPLLQIHKEAAVAAEAAACAGDQDRFWPMQDRLLAHQGQLKLADLKQHAVALGLDAAAFDRCLDSGAHTDTWRDDFDAATRLGVTGTPTFFINGRMVVGARPLEDFVRIVEEELELGPQKAAAAPAPTPAPALER